MGIKQAAIKFDEKYLGGNLRKVSRKLKSRRPNLYNPNYYNTYLDYPYRSYEAIEKLLSGKYEFETVLDIGCGEGIHSERFLNAGKKVTALDYGESVYFSNKKDNPDIETIVIDINKWETDRQFDCVWVSHILEHQLNVNLFLKKVYNLTKMGGVLCISVPPLKSQMVGGHVTLWNAGMLLYNLILAGFDCSDAAVKTYEYDISVILVKKEAELPPLTYDIGELRRLKEFFPRGIEFKRTENGLEEVFDGNIEKINW